MRLLLVGLLNVVCVGSLLFLKGIIGDNPIAVLTCICIWLFAGFMALRIANVERVPIREPLHIFIAVVGVLSGVFILIWVLVMSNDRFTNNSQERNVIK